jgi:hypothetical protein
MTAFYYTYAGVEVGVFMATDGYVVFTHGAVAWTNQSCL